LAAAAQHKGIVKKFIRRNALELGEKQEVITTPNRDAFHRLQLNDWSAAIF
jgi:hypothetical protein